MNELNELEKDIYKILSGHIYDKQDNNIARERESKKLSKFFLEAIKEAYLTGRFKRTIGRTIEEEFNDYLKSKYKI